MYCVNGNSSWYINCRPLFGGCPLLGASVIGGSTVYHFRYLVFSRDRRFSSAARISNRYAHAYDGHTYI